MSSSTGLRAVGLAALWLAVGGPADAHVSNYDMNSGTVFKETTASGTAITDPCHSVAEGVLCQSSNIFTRYGWYDGTEATLADSHYITTNAEFWVFHLSGDAVVTITATNYKPTSTSNATPVLDTVLNPAFSVYAGTLVPQGHDDTSGDPLQPVDANTFAPLPSPRDAGSVGWVYTPHDGYRDTVNNTYFGQFDAFANWSMANASGDWSQIDYISSVSNTPCSGTSCGTTTTGGFSNPGHVAGYNGSSETLTLALAAGDYTIAVGGESGNSANGAGGQPCTNVNGATGTAGACSGARLYATVTVAIGGSSTTSTSVVTTSTSSTSVPTSSTTTTSVTTTTLPPVTTDLLTGSTLLLKTKAGAPAKGGLSVGSKDTALTLGAGNDSEDDPTSAGATVRIRSVDGGFDDTYVLPASNWSLVGKSGQGKGYKYKDKSGPITLVVVKAGKSLKVTGKGVGLGHWLAVDPSPVDVAVTLGAHRYCLRFGGTTAWKVDKQFKASKAPAPAECAP